MTAGAGGGEQQDGGRSDVEMDGGVTRRRTAACELLFHRHSIPVTVRPEKRKSKFARNRREAFLLRILFPFNSSGFGDGGCSTAAMLFFPTRKHM